MSTSESLRTTSRTWERDVVLKRNVILKKLSRQNLHVTWQIPREPRRAEGGGEGAGAWVGK